MVLTRCSARRRRWSSFCGGVASRRNIDSAVSAGKFAAGGWPRPSFRWQLWQERELYIGPRPSELVVDDGAEIHSLRKMALPTLNLASPSKPMPCEKWEKASRVSMLSCVVALPPGFSSPGSLGTIAGSPARTATAATQIAITPGTRSNGRRSRCARCLWLVSMRAYRPTAGGCGAGCSFMPHGSGPVASGCGRVISPDAYRVIEAVGPFELDRLEL